MSRKRVALVAAALMAVGVVVGGVLPSTAQEAPPPIAAEFLSGRATFPDDIGMLVKRRIGGGGPTQVSKVDDPTHIVTGRYTIQPGAQFPWHTHAGPVIVTIVSGTLVYVEEDCSEHPYAAGTAFVDLGHGDVHSAFAPSNGGVTVILATFLEAPEAPAPLLIPADAPADCVITP
jgi:quercetin dioxygenase-like cupin family protein